jgi:hypothetical protein
MPFIVIIHLHTNVSVIKNCTNTLFSNFVNLCSSLNFKDQVSYPHTAAGKNTVFPRLTIVIGSTKIIVN